MCKTNSEVSFWWEQDWMDSIPSFVTKICITGVVGSVSQELKQKKNEKHVPTENTLQQTMITLKDSNSFILRKQMYFFY